MVYCRWKIPDISDGALLTSKKVDWEQLSFWWLNPHPANQQYVFIRCLTTGHVKCLGGHIYKDLSILSYKHVYFLAAT